MPPHSSGSWDADSATLFTRLADPNPPLPWSSSRLECHQINACSPGGQPSTALLADFLGRYAGRTNAKNEMHHLRLCLLCGPSPSGTPGSLPGVHNARTCLALLLHTYEVGNFIFLYPSTHYLCIFFVSGAGSFRAEVGVVVPPRAWGDGDALLRQDVPDILLHLPDGTFAPGV